MARRHFNWTLAIVLMVAAMVFAGAVFTLHRWQKGLRAERALPLGEQAYAEEQWDDAADQLGRYLGVRGDDVPILMKYGDAQLKRRPLTGGHIQHAVAAYRSVLRIDGTNAEAARQLVELYVTMGSAVEAEQVASQYVQNADSPDIRRVLALAQARLGKYPQAAKTLLDLIKDHPEDVLAYEVLGRLAQERPADVNAPAADWFDKAVTVNPQSALAYVVRGAFHRLHGRRDQALADFEQAGKCDLSDVDARLRLAQELIRANSVDKAKEHLTAMQAKVPKKAALWQTWAAAVLATGSAQEKATIAESGLKELGAYPWDFMPTAAELFVTAKQPERAQDCISQMRQRGLQPGLLAFLDGLVASAKDNLWEAAARWQEALAQGHTVHAYAGGSGAMVPVRMMLASTYTQLGDLQSASVQLQTLVSENPTYIEGRLALARLMTRMRNWASVREQAREILRLVPGYAEAVLLELQAQIFLLGDGDQTEPDRQRAWQDIGNRLTKADEATKGSVQLNAQVKLLQAQALIRQGKSAEAAKLLEEARSKTPSDIRTILLEADLLAGQGKVQEAMTLLRSAIEQSPQSVEPVLSLAVMLNRQKDTQQCESVIKQAIGRMQQPGARRELGMFLADLYRLWTRDDDLQKELTEMAKEFPHDIQIKRRLLACPAVAKDTLRAQNLVDEIKSLEGAKGWQWRYEQAKVWVNSGVKDPNVFRAHSYSETAKSLQENLLANPDDQASRLLLASAHELAGQKQLALSTYREAFNRSPNNIEIITQFVAALYRSRGAAEAKEADLILEKAGGRELSHPDLEKLELYGQRVQWQNQVRRGALDSASDTLQDFVRKDPNDVSASLWLARISMQQGRLDEAEVILKGLDAKAPESIPVTQARVQLHLLRGNTQEALRLCNETIQKNDQAIAYLLRAWTYAGLRENDKADADFKEAIAKDPGNAGIWTDRANFYQAVGRWAEAAADLRKALSLPAGTQPVLERVVPLCMASGDRTLVKEVETSLDKARIADPNNASLKLLKVRFLLNSATRQSIEQGQSLLREVTKANPEVAQAWYLLGRLELGQGQPGRALDTALGGLSNNEGDRNLLLLKADAEAARSPAAAITTLKPLLEQYPNDIEIEMRLAVAQYKSGDKKEGRERVDARMKADPNNPIPPTTLASLLVWEERWTDVAQHVANWTARHPEDALVVTTVARSLTATGNAEALKMAENLLDAARQRNPKSIPLVSSLAMLMQSSGRTAEAATLNRRVLELDPNNVIALNNLAWILCEENKQFQEALDLAERGLKIAPDYADLLDTRGVILYQLGRYDKATEDFTRCVDLYPPGTRSATSAYFHLARSHAAMGNDAKAEQCLEQTLDLQNRVGGLSTADLAETKVLLDKLQKDR